jgi:hypothetical protein
MFGGALISMIGPGPVQDVPGEIRTLQTRLIKKLPRYVSKTQIRDILRGRKTQVADLRGQVTEIEGGLDDLEAIAEDLDRRITALEP